jgi:hypothetical protein
LYSFSQLDTIWRDLEQGQIIELASRMVAFTLDKGEKVHFGEHSVNIQ